jgi:hypothetical protein
MGFVEAGCTGRRCPRSEMRSADGSRVRYDSSNGCERRPVR